MILSFDSTRAGKCQFSYRLETIIKTYDSIPQSFSLVPIAPPVPNAPILSVNDDIRTVVHRNLPGPVDGLILVFVNGGVTLVALTFHCPSFGVRDYVLMVGGWPGLDTSIFQNDFQDFFQEV